MARMIMAAGAVLAGAALVGLPTPVAASVPAPIVSWPPATVAQQQVSATNGACTAGDRSAVTVVVDFQQLGGDIIVRCARGLDQGASGLKAIQAAGITPGPVQRWGLSFICRLQGRPAVDEVLQVDGREYTEKCIDTPPAKAYWSYWQADNAGSWHYSQLGVMSSKARLGGLEGWSFSLNATESTNPAPRVSTVLPEPAPAPSTSKPPVPSTSKPAPPKPPATTPSPTQQPKPTTSRPTAPKTTAPKTTAPEPARSTTARATDRPSAAPTSDVPEAEAGGSVAASTARSAAVAEADTGTVPDAADPAASAISPGTPRLPGGGSAQPNAATGAGQTEPPATSTTGAAATDTTPSPAPSATATGTGRSSGNSGATDRTRTSTGAAAHSSSTSGSPSAGNATSTGPSAVLETTGVNGSSLLQLSTAQAGTGQATSADIAPTAGDSAGPSATTVIAVVVVLAVTGGAWILARRRRSEH